MFNLRHGSHRALSDFLMIESDREVIDWAAYGYSSSKNAYNTLRVSAKVLELPVYVAYEKYEPVLYRINI